MSPTEFGEDGKVMSVCFRTTDGVKYAYKVSARLGSCLGDFRDESRVLVVEDLNRAAAPGETKAAGASDGDDFDAGRSRQLGCHGAGGRGPASPFRRYTTIFYST